MKTLLKLLALRILSGLPLLLFLSLLTFSLMQLVPGNYFDSLRLNPQISAETIQKYEAIYGLDQPVIVQYFRWLGNLCRLDLGYSFAFRQPVTEVLGSRMINTLLLNAVALSLAWVLAVMLGLLSGVRENSLLDRLSRFVSYLSLSIPSFFLCLLLLLAAIQFDGFPLGGMKSVLHDRLSVAGKLVDIARHMVIPVTVLTLASFAYLYRLMRSQTLEAKKKEFIFFLRANRISDNRITFHHIARNAVNPLVSHFGLELPVLFSGSALVEIFTGWPGLGQVMLQAVRSQDLFLVLGNLMMIAVLLIFGNLIADVLLVLVDPRIRMSGGKQ